MQQQDIRAQMDVFQSRQARMGAVVGLIVGLLLGWFVLGWWLVPVQWVNARPSDLHPQWQEHYVAMVVDSYLLTGDRQTAQARLEGFDEETLGRVLGQVEARFEQRGATRQAQGVRQLADLLDVSILPAGAPTAVATGVPTQAAEAPVASVQPSGIPGWLIRVAQVCGIALLAMLVIVGGVAGFLWFQRRSMQFEDRRGPAEQASRRARTEPRIGSITLGEQVTIQYRDEGPDFEQTYQIYRGDEIIGSCGLRGVSTLSGGGHVAACAAWLYEQKFPERSADTRVLASRRVYQNPALRSSLIDERDPGKVIPALPGQTAHLAHETLEMALRVMHVEYYDPGEQYISRLIVEMEPVTKRREAELRAPDFSVNG